MKKISKGLLVLFSFSIHLIAEAQDPHFSQYFNTPLYINPANAGNGIEYMRATLIYRNQWASVASPFVTEGFMVDKTVNRLGFGLCVVKNSAGKASLKQLNLDGVLSYNQPIGENNHVSGALQVGMLHKSFDPSQMTFDSQFNEDVGFDPSINSGEIFTYTSITRPDVGLGFMWQRGLGNKKINFKPFAGIAISHINKPSETFIVNNNKLPVKSTYNFGAGIMVKDNLELRPSVLYSVQDHFHEFNFGTVASFIMENNNKFQIGFYDRSNDALIIYAGYQVNRMFIGTSYDINTSGLKQASHGSGGFEITLSFIPKAPKKSRAPEPAKAPKALVNKAPHKVQKAEKKFSVKPVEQAVSVPEKLENRNVPPVRLKPDDTVKPIEPSITNVQEKKTVEPVPVINRKINVEQNPEKEKPVIAEKPKEQIPLTIALPKEEPKAVIREKVVPVISKEITAVKEKKTNAPSTLKLPANRVAVNPKLNTQFGEEKNIEPETKATEAAIEFSSVNKTIPAGKKAETVEPKSATKEIVLPKSHTVYIDLNKPAAAVVTNPAEGTKLADTDGDGITDDKDHCPYIRGGDKTQGCPDSDGDGIQDMMDECPMEPGTSAHFGCPDVKATVDNAMLIKKFNNVEFETGKATVKTTDIYDIVEYAIDIMYQYPNSHVILSGHTDNEGNNLSNMYLSEKRNMIVKNYMIKKGINTQRIQIVNYGETMPLKDNNTEFGRARNRRVEINILR